MLKLQFRDRRQEAVWLVDHHFTIGTDSANSLMVNDASLAPQHAEIENRQDRLFVKNIASASDVFINGSAVASEAPIGANDVLRLGSVEFEIVDPKKDVAQYEQQLKELNRDNWKMVSNASWLEQKIFELQGSVTVGRETGCDICLPLDHLSRKHALIEVKGKRLFVKDLNSSNGTYVNGNRVTEAELHAGDKLKLDVVTFEIQSPNAPDPNRTIIRTVETSTPPPQTASPAPAPPKPVHKSKSNGPKPEAKNAGNAPIKKKPLVAQGKQDWIKNDEQAVVKGSGKGWLLVVAVALIGAAIGLVAML